MFVVLYESHDNTILSELDVFYKNYPPTARGYLGAKFKAEDIKRFQYAPLLAIGWLILVNANIKKFELYMLHKLGEFNMIVFTAHSKTEMENIVALLEEEEVEFSLIDNYIIPKEKLVDYISKRLRVTDSLATKIYSICGGYLKDIVTSIRILEEFSVVNTKMVEEYVGKSVRHPIFSILSYLLGTSEDWTYEEVLSVVHNYRYAYNYLRKYLLKEIGAMLEVNKYVQAGILAKSNTKEFRMKYRSDSVGKLSENKLKKILTDLEVVSDEYLWYLFIQLKDLSDQRKDLYKIVLLLKLKQNGGT